MPSPSTSSTAAEEPAGEDTCPACGEAALEPAGSGGQHRRVCRRCGCCWEFDAGASHEVDSIACPGCPRRGVCESRPTSLVRSSERHLTLRDATAVLVRPLLYSDRFEIAAAFEQLSPASRRMRFFSPPDHLDDGELDHLTNLDYRDHYALAAFAEHEPGGPGIAVARYIRDPSDAEAAEVAVTVLDAYQRRGLGTLLLLLLADDAAERGVRTFVSYVRWDNVDAVNGLTDVGARIRPAEPGVARIEIDLPVPAEAVDENVVHRILHELARLVHEAVARIPTVSRTNGSHPEP